MLTKETAQNMIRKYADIINAGEYEYYGIRCQDENETIGDTVSHVSHVWDDGDDTGEELEGLSAMSVSQIDAIGLTCYMGDRLVLLGSYSADYGEDAGEIIMKDAVVLAIE